MERVCYGCRKSLLELEEGHYKRNCKEFLATEQGKK